MHRIRTSSAALLSAVALSVAGAPAVAHAADAPTKEPCAQQQREVDKAEDALARVTAVFAKKQERVQDARAAVKHADSRSEKAQARAELKAAKEKKEHAAKAKKAQQQRLAKAQERLATCQAEDEGTTTS